MAVGYSSNNTCVHYMNYHFVWTPKYHRKIFYSGREIFLKKLIFRKCYDLELRVLQLEVMPDHIHLFLQADPQLKPNYIIQQIKGFTSKIVRERCPDLKWMPSLWTRSYFVSTHGHTSSKTIKKYIRDQKQTAYEKEKSKAA